MNTLDKKTILVVEDEYIISSYIARLLQNYCYKVICAYTGEAAIEIALSSQEISLVLMDIDLGKGINGTKTAEEILKARNVPIVFHTSHTEQEYVDKVRGITSYGYVVKNSGEFVLKSSLEMAFKLYNAHVALLKKIDELERINNLSVDRELRMIALKKEVNSLLATSGKEQKYSIAFESETN